MTVRFLTGDCRAVLGGLAADSVHCVVTSPPYWGLRDYGVAPTVWGGDPKCRHVWGGAIAINATNHTGTARWNHTRNGRAELQPARKRVSSLRTSVEQGAFCRRCGAWRGVFGLEPSVDLYVNHAVEVFRAVRRVLRPDGMLWLNLGDSYAGGKTGNTNGTGTSGLKRDGRSEDSRLRSIAIQGVDMAAMNFRKPLSDGLKPKDLCGMPWRVAFALQADGWFLRQDIIWHKPNPMPESVTDRCTKAHEYIFLLTKSARYFFDAEAIKEDVTGGTHGGASRPSTLVGRNAVTTKGGKESSGLGLDWNEPTRNKRSVWTVSTSPFPQAHFATFPPKLIEPCILASSSERGCCAKCGAPWVRKTSAKSSFGSWTDHADDLGKGAGGGFGRQRKHGYLETLKQPVRTIGWRPTCACRAGIVPATVLDPFGGAGTTGLVADRLGRGAVLIELGAKYVAMAKRRIAAARKKAAPTPLRLAACRRK